MGINGTNHAVLIRLSMGINGTNHAVLIRLSMGINSLAQRNNL